MAGGDRLSLRTGCRGSGRARTPGQPGEALEGVGDIGRLTSDGRLTGFFAADPGHTIEVDHLLGANMSFGSDVLARMGGLREGFPGTCLREETDICLRIRRLGFRIVLNPRAVVDHVAAPQFRGQRFDVRYDYYAQRNHLVLLLRNFGPSDPVVRRYLTATVRTLTRSSSSVCVLAASPPRPRVSRRAWPDS